MRWSLSLKSPVLVAGKREPDQGALEGGLETLRLGPDGDGRWARVAVFADSASVQVAVLAEGPPGVADRPDHPEWTNRAHLAVLLDPNHDHATRWLYAVDDRGRVVREAHWASSGEELGDDAAAEVDGPPEGEGEFRYVDGSRFYARLRFPRARRWENPGVPAGLALRVGYHEIPIPDPLAWPPLVPWTRDTPLVFGDVSADPPVLAVEEVAIPHPSWGGEPSTITLKGGAADGSPCAGKVLVDIVLPGDGEYSQEPVAWHRDGKEFSIAVPVVFPFRAKWANGLKSIARLGLTVVGDNGQVLWVGRYPFGFDHGVIVRERYGRRAGEPSPRPEPSQGDFLDAFRRYVLTRIPDYTMQTTRDGAPSDFYLVDRDGNANLDLSAPDALEHVAAHLASRFPDWQDALCAAAMWVHHPSITRHSSTWSRVSNVASIETIPRLAGCFCGDTTRLTALLAETVGARTGVPLKGLSMGLRGHLATLVETPIGSVVIDGMLGLWFHTLDNTRLATLDEMRADREISERVWYAPRAHGHEFFYGEDNQLIRAFRSGPLEWPKGGET